MAYIPGFDSDIFISYSHVNNLHPDEEPKGWIEQFYERLKILLAQNYGKTDRIRIWWDSKRLDGNIQFDPAIGDGVRKSAILLCLNSWGYLDSAYCDQERQMFVDANPPGSLVTGTTHRSRIVNVLLNNIPYARWPREFPGRTGFAFHDGKEEEDYGDPLDPKGDAFKNSMHQLRDALVELIDELAGNEGDSSPGEPQEETGKEQPFTIFMGEVADTLRSTRKKVVAELENKGFRIVTNIPPPDEEDAHKNKVKQVLEHCDLAVHMLDQLPGREITGTADNWYPREQAQLGLESAGPKIIWVPADIQFSSIEEKPYQDFLSALEMNHSNYGRCDFIRGYQSNLAREIMDVAESLKQKPAAAGEQVSVLLDTHYRDQLYAFDLSRTLLEHQIQPFVNPSEDDPHRNIRYLEERISQVSKLIFLYGNVTREWVVERMSAALQLILTKNLPIQKFFIFMIPPLKNKEDIELRQKFLKIDVIDNSNQPQLDHSILNRFITDLKAATE